MNKKLLNDADGIVNEMVARTDGIFTNTVAAADAYLDRMQQVAMATIRKAENEASVVQSNRLAMASAGGEMQIKMRIAQSLKGKPIVMMPGNDAGTGGLSVRTFDVNDFLKTSGLLKINERK
jgi:ABC-type phosphonate transport system ATPase subunit